MRILFMLIICVFLKQCIHSTFIKNITQFKGSFATYEVEEMYSSQVDFQWFFYLKSESNSRFVKAYFTHESQKLRTNEIQLEDTFVLKAVSKQYFSCAIIHDTNTNDLLLYYFESHIPTIYFESITDYIDNSTNLNTATYEVSSDCKNVRINNNFYAFIWDKQQQMIVAQNIEVAFNWTTIGFDRTLNIGATDEGIFQVSYKKKKYSKAITVDMYDTNQIYGYAIDSAILSYQLDSTDDQFNFHYVVITLQQGVWRRVYQIDDTASKIPKILISDESLLVLCIYEKLDGTYMSLIKINYQELYGAQIGLPQDIIDYNNYFMFSNKFFYCRNTQPDQFGNRYRWIYKVTDEKLILIDKITLSQSQIKDFSQAKIVDDNDLKISTLYQMYLIEDTVIRIQLVSIFQHQPKVIPQSNVVLILAITIPCSIGFIALGLFILYKLQIIFPQQVKIDDEVSESLQSYMHKMQRKQFNPKNFPKDSLFFQVQQKNSSETNMNAENPNQPPQIDSKIILTEYQNQTARINRKFVTNLQADPLYFQQMNSRNQMLEVPQPYQTARQLRTAYNIRNKRNQIIPTRQKRRNQ